MTEIHKPHIVTLYISYELQLSVIIINLKHYRKGAEPKKEYVLVIDTRILIISNGRSATLVIVYYFYFQVKIILCIT